MIRLAELEDWHKITGCWDDLQKTPTGKKIIGTIEEIKLMFLESFLPNSTLRFYTVWELGATLVGIAVTQELMIPTWVQDRMVNKLNTFIRVVYVMPGPNSREHTAALLKRAEGFAKSRGHSILIGNCRSNFPVKAAERLYGFKPNYLVMAKSLEGDGNG